MTMAVADAPRQKMLLENALQALKLPGMFCNSQAITQEANST
jgi:hypothetical protein